MHEFNQKEVAFFGKITAATTHEMKNVLATIKESSGLMEDLITLSPETPPSLREKFQKTLSVIQNQIRRGSEISDRLNRFAHSTDSPVEKIELQSAAEQIVALSQRFSRNKNVELKIDPPTLAMTVETLPVRLLMTLFGCIECCLTALPPGSRIHVGTRQGNRGATVYFECRGDFSETADLARAISADSRWPALEETADSLGATVELDGTGASIRLYFTKTPA